ncbi:hypothetical protein Tco_0899225 [Tanacetum coccineum]
MADSAWIESHADELHQFGEQGLKVWELETKNCTAMSSAEAEYVELSASVPQSAIQFSCKVGHSLHKEQA